MIGRLFRRGVPLTLGSAEARVRDLAALRAALAPHVAVSPLRLAELAAMSNRALEARTLTLESLAGRLAQGPAGDGPAPAELLAQVQARDLPLPRAWADALASAREWGPGRAAFQRVLLECLAEHLGAERACVRALAVNRQHGAGAADDTEHRQRLLFDVGDLSGSRGPENGFERIARGEPREVSLHPGQALELLLSQHPFLLVCGVPWLLIDDTGADLRLRAGRNVVGRNKDCDAVVHENYRAVSRRHAVLETRGTEAVLITDLSSLGTYL